MEGLSFDSESLSGLIYEAGVTSLGAAHVLSSLIMDLPDKIITVLLAILIVRFVPAGFLHHFGFSMWMQDPAAEDIRKKRADRSTLFRD